MMINVAQENVTEELAVQLGAKESNQSMEAIAEEKLTVARELDCCDCV